MLGICSYNCSQNTGLFLCQLYPAPCTLPLLSQLIVSLRVGFSILGYTVFQSGTHKLLSCGEHITQARLHLDPIRKSMYLILGGIDPSSAVSPIISSRVYLLSQ